jgi:hypothetical protein
VYLENVKCDECIIDCAINTRNGNYRISDVTRHIPGNMYWKVDISNNNNNNNNNNKLNIASD